MDGVGFKTGFTAEMIGNQFLHVFDGRVFPVEIDAAPVVGFGHAVADDPEMCRDIRIGPVFFKCGICFPVPYEEAYGDDAVFRLIHPVHVVAVGRAAHDLIVPLFRFAHRSVVEEHHRPGTHGKDTGADTVTGKIALVMQAKEANVPIIICMSAGNKMDPTAFEVTDIYKTSVCPLAKVMRYELKKRGIKKLKVVYSKEQPIKPVDDMTISCRAHCICPPGTARKCTERRQVPGSNAFVPSAAGLIIAGEVIKDLIKNKSIEPDRGEKQ